MQKCYRKVPDTSLQARKNHICATNLGFLKKIVKTSEKNNTKLSEKNREKYMLKNEGYGAEGTKIFGHGQKFSSQQTPLVSQHLKTGGLVLGLGLILAAFIIFIYPGMYFASNITIQKSYAKCYITF